MITIHVGLHKTGSTSIQTALEMVQHRRDLLIVSPRVSGAWTDVARMTQLKRASDTRHVIISDEGILGDMADAYESAGDRLSQVRTALSDVPYEVIMYVRPQPDWLSSVYLQLVQQGGTLTAEEFWDSVQARQHLAWARLSDCVRAESGAQRIRIRAYAPGRDSVADFFDFCGLGRAPRPTAVGIRINESISAVQAPILAALNRAESLTRDEQLQVRRLFQDRLAVADGRNWSPFPEDVQMQIVDRFRADWQAVAALLDEGDSSEAAVFRATAAAWDGPARPCPGSAVTDPLVARELFRCFSLMSPQLQDGADRGFWRRASAKLRENPSDAWASIRRAVRRTAQG